MSLRVWFPLGIILLWLLMALLGPLMALEPNQIELSKILLNHDSNALLGYDDLGRPLWDRLVMGAQTSFMVAIGVVTISLIVGTLIGAVSGYLGGWFDHLVTRIIDIFLAFPGILLAIAMAGILGPGVENVVIALAVVSWVGFARLSRAQVLSVKHREHVQAAIALGVSPVLIVLRHLLPLIMAPLIIEATFGVASVV
ncbi:Oligopeptide transport system permease protein OppC (TC 3.A.1.5.1), partial [hydrothermal vent metagenome]